MRRQAKDDEMPVACCDSVPAAVFNEKPGEKDHAPAESADPSTAGGFIYFLNPQEPIPLEGAPSAHGSASEGVQVSPGCNNRVDANHVHGAGVVPLPHALTQQLQASEVTGVNSTAEDAGALTSTNAPPLGGANAAAAGQNSSPPDPSQLAADVVAPADGKVGAPSATLATGGLEPTHSAQNSTQVDFTTDPPKSAGSSRETTATDLSPRTFAASGRFAGRSEIEGAGELRLARADVAANGDSAARVAPHHHPFANQPTEPNHSASVELSPQNVPVGFGAPSAMGSGAPMAETVMQAALPYRLAETLVAQQHLDDSTSDRSFLFRLDPPELGAVSIRMMRDAQGLRIRMSAERESTLAIIRGQVHQIRHALEQTDLRVAQLELTWGETGMGTSGGHQSPENGQQQGLVDATPRFTRQMNLADTGREAASVNASLPDGHLDFRA